MDIAVETLPAATLLLLVYATVLTLPKASASANWTRRNGLALDAYLRSLGLVIGMHCGSIQTSSADLGILITTAHKDGLEVLVFGKYVKLMITTDIYMYRKLKPMLLRNEFEQKEQIARSGLRLHIVKHPVIR
eukprot:5723877-Pleurochrysis_carterae.AAC.3